LEKEFDLEILWHGFELHPRTPIGGMDLAQLHPESGNSDMGGYILKFAARFGITDIKPSKRLPNTRRALAISEFARDHGKLDEFRSRVMDAHWKEELDIENDAVLRNIAISCGLDGDQALAAGSDSNYQQRIDQTRLDYKRLRVGGIPTFVFPTEIIEGCQPYEEIAEVALRSGALRKTQSS
jgi:predicted DsbA family dithiol-disulfide isomerase